MSRNALLAAASLSAVTTAAATAVALRHPDLPDEALGLRIPGEVHTHLALGLGSGIATPWPMPVIALVAASQHDETSVAPARICAALGAMMLVGTLVEPASWGLRPRSEPARATVVLNLLSGASLFLAGTWSLPPARVETTVDP